MAIKWSCELKIEIVFELSYFLKDYFVTLKFCNCNYFAVRKKRKGKI